MSNIARIRVSISNHGQVATHIWGRITRDSREAALIERLNDLIKDFYPEYEVRLALQERQKEMRKRAGVS